MPRVETTSPPLAGQTSEAAAAPAPSSPVMSILKVAKDVLVYGSGDLLLRATALITLPLYSRLFAPGQYGVWSFFVTIGLLLNSTLVLGADSGYARFFFAAGDRRQQRELTSTVLLLIAVTSGAAALAALPFTPALSEWAFGGRQYAVLFALTFLTAPLVVLNTAMAHVLRSEFRPGLFALLNAATAAVGVAASVYLIVARGMGVTGVLVGAFLAAALVLPFRLWTIRSLIAASFSLDVARRFLAYGLPLVPASLAGWTLALSDRLVLAKLGSFSDVGLYTVAASVVSLMTFLLAPLAYAWLPHAVRAYELDPVRAASFYGRMLTYVLSGFGFLAVVVTAFGREVILLLATPNFLPATAVLAPLALAGVALASTQVTSLSLTLRHRTGTIALLTAVAAGLNVALNILLVPSYGMRGSAAASAVALVALTIGYALVSRGVGSVAYEVRATLGIAAATVAFVIGARYLPATPLSFALAVKLVYSLGFVGTLFVFGALGRREVEAGRAMLRRTPLRVLVPE